MRTQTVLFTAWLLLPIAIIAGLMAWIFQSMDKDRLMADAPAVGAGAGDTGGANALGQLIAGRDPDAVELALRARREGRAIAPGAWPGGLRLRISQSAFGSAPDEPLVIAFDRAAGSITTAPLLPEGGGADASVVLDALLKYPEALDRTLFVSPGPVTIDADTLRGPSGRPLAPLRLRPRVPGPDLPVSEPMRVTLEGVAVWAD